MDGRVFEKLREFYDRNGYLRLPNASRRKKRRRKYKKGYEMRLAAHNNKELREIRALLRRAGVKLGRPFESHSRKVQPVYGRKSVAMLCKAMGIKETGKRRRSP